MVKVVELPESDTDALKILNIILQHPDGLTVAYLKEKTGLFDRYRYINALNKLRTRKLIYCRKKNIWFPNKLIIGYPARTSYFNTNKRIIEIYDVIVEEE